MNDQRRPHESPPVFFVDRCLGSNTVPTALRQAGLTIQIHDDHFPRDEPDLSWLPAVGSRGWAVLTEDRHIKTRVLELAALLKAQTHVFVLRPVKSLSGQQKAAAFCAAAKQMHEIVLHKSPPVLATVSPSGSVGNLQGYATLQKLFQSLRGTP